jgi:hypothetical protein
LLAAAQQLLESRQILRRGDDEVFAYPREQENAQRVIDHRLVVHRQELFARDQRQWIEPGTCATREDDADSFL